MNQANQQRTIRGRAMSQTTLQRRTQQQPRTRTNSQGTTITNVTDFQPPQTPQPPQTISKKTENTSTTTRL